MSAPSLKADEIFWNAVRMASEADRKAYLKHACSDSVRRHVERLLAALPQAEDFWRAAEISAEVTLPKADSQIDQAGLTISGYTLLEQIGEGGMGVVYAADQMEPVRRRVALKVVKPGMDSRSVLQRFEAERHVLALMEHPNIARVFDAGTTDDGRPYFVMELVRGIRITDYSRNQHLDLAARLRLFVRVCHAAQHAHQKGIIHRDLKPSNILVEQHDVQAVPKIIDFGIAKAVERSSTTPSGMTRFYEILGTPMYMSPEQAEMNAQDVDTRSDVYSLGVLLYELVTNQLPFERSRIYNVPYDDWQQIIREELPPRPSSRITTQGAGARTAANSRPAVPMTPAVARRFRGELDWIVMKALEKDRERRYQSPRELADDVVRFLDHEPLEARAPSTTYRLKKMAQRHRTLLTACSAVLISLLAGTVVSLWQAWQADIARAQAESQARILERTNQQLEQQKSAAEKARTAANQMLYATEVHLASIARDRGDIPGARALLARQKQGDRASLTDSYEWNYLNRLVDVQPEWTNRFVGEIRCARLSPDGRWLAVAARDACLRVLDVDTGRTACQILTWTMLNSAAWSADGQRIACAAADGTVLLFSFEYAEEDEQQSSVLRERELKRIGSMKVQTAPEVGHYYDAAGEANDAFFTLDGRKLVTGGDDTLIRIHDLHSDAEPVTMSGHGRAVERMALHPSGPLLATVSSDATLRLWNIDTGKSHGEPVEFSGRVVSVAFSPDGSLVAAGDIDGSVVVLEVESGEISRKAIFDGVESLTFLQSPLRLAAGDRGGAVHLWQMQNTAGERFADDQHFTWSASDGRVQTLATNRRTGALISGTRLGEVAAWRADVHGAPIQLPEVLAVEFRQSGDLLVGCHQLLQVNIGSGDVSHLQLPAEAGWKLMATSTETSRAVLASDKKIVVQDLESHTVVAEWDCNHDIHRVAISPDGALVATVDYDADVVLVRSVINGSVVEKLPARACRCVSFSPDGKVLAAGSLNDVLLYPLELRPTQNAPATVEIPVGSDRHPDGDVESTSPDDSAVRATPICLSGHDSTLTSLSFSPDGCRMVTGSRDRHVKTWDLRTGEMLLSVPGHADGVESVRHSRDGSRIISGGADQQVRVWHAETLQPLLDLKLPVAGPVAFAALSPDNEQLVVHTSTGELLIYHATGTGRTSHLIAGPEMQAAQLTPLGDLPGGDFHSYCIAMSPDGRAVVGVSRVADGFSPFVWTQAEGIRRLGPPPPEARNGAAGCVSEDHSVFGGAGGLRSERGYSPRLWFSDGSTRRLAPGHGTVSDLSADGSTAIGHSTLDGHTRAFVSTDGKYTVLPVDDSDDQAIATKMSADGQVILGNVFRSTHAKAIVNEDACVYWRSARPVLWHSEKLQRLSGFDPAWNWRAVDVSADGTVVTGNCWAPGDRIDTPGARMFLWCDGQVRLIEPPPGILEVRPAAMSGDGTIVVGLLGRTLGQPSGSRAFWWTQELGFVDLNSLPCSGSFKLLSATAVSRDGRRIAGYGLNSDGHHEAFRLTLDR